MSATSSEPSSGDGTTSYLVALAVARREGSHVRRLAGACDAQRFELHGEDGVTELAGRPFELPLALANLIDLRPVSIDDGLVLPLPRDVLDAPPDGAGLSGRWADLVAEARDDDGAVIAERLEALACGVRWRIEATWLVGLEHRGRAFEFVDSGREFFSVHPLVDDLMLRTVTSSEVWEMITTLLPFDEDWES